MYIQKFGKILGIFWIFSFVQKENRPKKEEYKIPIPEASSFCGPIYDDETVAKTLLFAAAYAFHISAMVELLTYLYITLNFSYFFTTKEFQCVALDPARSQQQTAPNVYLSASTFPQLGHTF